MRLTKSVPQVDGHIHYWSLVLQRWKPVQNSPKSFSMAEECSFLLPDVSFPWPIASPLPFMTNQALRKFLPPNFSDLGLMFSHLDLIAFCREKFFSTSHPTLPQNKTSTTSCFVKPSNHARPIESCCVSSSLSKSRLWFICHTTWLWEQASTSLLWRDCRIV